MMRWLLEYTSGRSFIFDGRARGAFRLDRLVTRRRLRRDAINTRREERTKERMKRKKWRALISSEKMVLYVISSSPTVVFGVCVCVSASPMYTFTLARIVFSLVLATEWSFCDDDGGGARCSFWSHLYFCFARLILMFSYFMCYSYRQSIALWHSPHSTVHKSLCDEQMSRAMAIPFRHRPTIRGTCPNQTRSRIARENSFGFLLRIFFSFYFPFFFFLLRSLRRLLCHCHIYSFNFIVGIKFQVVYITHTKYWSRYSRMWIERLGRAMSSDGRRSSKAHFQLQSMKFDKSH